MNEEINRAIDDLLGVACCPWHEESCKKVYDYITNLQQEINKLTAESTEWESKCYDLQEENERLKEYYDIMVEFNQKNLDRFCDYKSRCEKAIEYVNKHIRIDDEYPAYMEMLIEERDVLLNILQNGSDSQ